MKTELYLFGEIPSCHFWLILALFFYVMALFVVGGDFLAMKPEKLKYSFQV
jgi:hypothetical protein